MDNLFETGNSKKSGRDTRGTLYSYDKDKILQRQKGLCAGKDCKRLHNGKRMPVNIRSNFDHTISLALGGKDNISNLQALCANCHQLKTREDRKLIAINKKRKTKKSSDSSLFNLGNSSKSSRKRESLFGDLP